MFHHLYEWSACSTAPCLLHICSWPDGIYIFNVIIADPPVQGGTNCCPIRGCCVWYTLFFCPMHPAAAGQWAWTVLWTTVICALELPSSLLFLLLFNFVVHVSLSICIFVKVIQILGAVKLARPQRLGCGTVGQHMICNASKSWGQHVCEERASRFSRIHFSFPYVILLLLV
jgi:hypothetical protein